MDTKISSFDHLPLCTAPGLLPVPILPWDVCVLTPHVWMPPHFFKYLRQEAHPLCAEELSLNEQTYFKTLRSEKRKIQFLSAHVLLHKNLKSYFQLTNTPLLSRKDSGQWIAERTDEKIIFFSISHDEDKIFLGLSHEPIGVDVQRIQPLRVAQKVFHPFEQRVLSELRNKINIKTYEDAYLFSLKEAFGKCLGTGLTGMREIDFSENFSRQTSFTFSHQLKDYVLSLEVQGEFVYTTCVQKQA